MKKLRLVLGITTYNRCSFLRRAILSWNQTRNKKHAWTLIIADDGSVDETHEFLGRLNMPKVKIKIIQNNRRGVHHQTNQILKAASKLKFDVGFKIDDDVTFNEKGWDGAYIDAIEKTGFDHLVFYDENWGKVKRNLSFRHACHNSGLLECKTIPTEVQGAFWTFTPRVIKEVGYFDLNTFGLCGYGHTDYTWRCCRAGFNDLSSPFDLAESDKYIALKVAGYKLSLPDDTRYYWNSPAKVAEKKGRLSQNRIYIPYNESSTNIENRSVTRPSISFIVPYRAREDQIEGLLHNIKQNYGEEDYEIILAAQDDPQLFRRGQLCNLGYKKSKGQIIVFQDVDIRHFRPIDFEDEITRARRPVLAFSHISQIEETSIGGYKEIRVESRPEAYGACAFFTREQFEMSNGFSNLIIGWGAEDNLINCRANFSRMNNVLGHVFHTHDMPMPLIRSSDWHRKNVFFWKTDGTRNRTLDSFRQTIAEEGKPSKIGDKSNVIMYHFSNITVTDDFPYMTYLEGRP